MRVKLKPYTVFQGVGHVNRICDNSDNTEWKSKSVWYISKKKAALMRNRVGDFELLQD